MDATKISILTPTYNRVKLLPRLYNSILNNNSNLQIEWLVMDDGSTDNTKELIESYKEANKIDIKYFFQENKGKMTALNFLVKQANGDYIIECDSDDYFINNAFNIIEREIINLRKNLKYDEQTNKSKEKEETQNNIKENIYALCFLKYDQNMENIGKLAENEETTMFNMYFKEGETGEKALVFNAKIRKQYEHILEHNEKFVTEARMYHKMDLEYKMKCINEPIMVCEYQKGGYTNNIIKVFKENPYGYLEYFKEIFQQDLKGVTLKKRLYIIKHYILFSTLTKNKKVLANVKGVQNKILTAILYIPGKIATKMSH